MAIKLKTREEIALMSEAGKIVGGALALLTEKAKPGVTTAELDALAASFITGHHAVASFKGYRGFPASICASVNEEVVHGIPDGRVLKDGDILSIDVGAIYKGMHGDGATTVPVGNISEAAQRLLTVGQEALRRGVDQARSGNHLGDISATVQKVAEGQGFSVVREYVGHGIGRDMHEDPQIPNFGRAGYGPVLKPGMVLAIEPMINIGTYEVRLLGNGWTVVTVDGSLSAHFEHTVAITTGEPEILTAFCYN
jgi:methionyl aminopeptidase